MRHLFEGVPNNEMLWLLATEHCIINRLVSQAPFMLLLGPHIKALFFERAKVAPSFDLVFVLQVDNDVDVQIISQIPSKYLEPLKRVRKLPCSHLRLSDLSQWADARALAWWASPVSIDWDEVIEFVESDPKGFESRGGWGGLLKGSHASASGGGSRKEEKKPKAAAEPKDPDVTKLEVGFASG